MDPARKLVDIQEGVFLSDCTPQPSIRFGAVHFHDAIERPIPVAVHDPQASLVQPKLIFARGSGDDAKETKQLDPNKSSTNWLQAKEADSRFDRLEIRSRVSERASHRSRLSITPSFIHITPAQPLSVAQTVELSRLSRHGPPMEVILPMDVVDEPPDGGTMAWLHTVAGHLVAFVVQGLNLSFGIFQAYYQGFLLRNRTASQIAWIGSSQVFLIFATCIVASPLVDKGLFRLCFNGGSVLLVIAVLLTSFCTQWWQLLLVQGILTGIAMGLVFGSAVIVLMAYFSKHMGKATGIVASGSSTGGIIFPLIGSRLLFRVGFAWTVRVMALVVLVLLIIANIIVRPRPGYKPNGSPQMDWTAFRDVPYMLMMAGMFFSFWGVYFGFYYMVSFGEAILHLNPTQSVNLLIAMNAANFPGRFIPNLISDACIGPLNTIIPSTFLAGMMIFLWIGSATYTSLLVVACFYGFAAAGLQGLYIATIYSFCPDLSKAGIRIAMVYVAIGLACLTGSPIGGALIRGNDGGYLSAQLFAGCNILLGAILLLAARLVKTGWAPSRV